MSGLADDLRRATPIIGVVVATWVALFALWYVTLLWATSPTGYLAPLFICQASIYALGTLSMAGALAGIPLLFGRRRVLAIVLLLSCLSFVGTGQLLGPRVHQLRERRIRQFAERSRPLVAAIEAFEREKGQPPDALEALVPGYLPSLPATGMGAFPDVIYVRDGSHWRLRVPIGATPLDWVALEYSSRQNYPGQTTFDGWTLDIG